MVAGMLLAAVPFAADPFLRLSGKALGALSVGGFLGSLAAVLVLMAVPVLLLGTVAPYANRLALGRVVDTGTETRSAAGSRAEDGVAVAVPAAGEGHAPAGGRNRCDVYPLRAGKRHTNAASPRRK